MGCSAHCEKEEWHHSSLWSSMTRAEAARPPPLHWGELLDRVRLHGVQVSAHVAHVEQFLVRVRRAHVEQRFSTKPSSRRDVLP
jgi:hypothetical protein